MDLNLNERAAQLLEEASSRACDVVDYGKSCVLDFSDCERDEAACLVAAASCGGLASVKVEGGRVKVEVSKNPAVATLSCQLAGWMKNFQGKPAFCSGPARILAKKPREI